jgi:protein BCP1
MQDMDMVNVEFEWFDPQPDVDFHGLKTLLRQLLDIDNQLFDLSALADLILSQPLLGSTVKVDGNETDPYAFLTVLNLSTHKDKPVIQQLTQYFAKQASRRGGELGQSLPALLADDNAAQVGLILTERFINMPHEIVPPMYTMLQEEIQWALEENEPYKFTHYLVISKTYTEIKSTLPTDDQPRSKKMKGGSAGEPETFYFHPEDEVLHQHAVGWTSFDYESPRDEGASDSKRAFQDLGVKPMGHMILIEAGKFADAVEAVKSFLNGGQ